MAADGHSLTAARAATVQVVENLGRVKGSVAQALGGEMYQSEVVGAINAAEAFAETAVQTLTIAIGDNQTVQDLSRGAG